MLNQVCAVAMSTFRETVRDRIFYLVGLFGFVLVASSAVLSPLTVGAQDKIVSDVGLAAMSVFGLLVVVFVGSNLVRKELDKRTVTTILAKPLSRRIYLLGKYCGLSLTLACMLGVMGLLYVAVLVITPADFAWSYVTAIYLTLLELLLINALVLLLSAAISPILAAVLTLVLYVIGHLSESLLAFGDSVGSAIQARIARLVYYVVPNLEIFNVRGAVVHGDVVSGEHVLLATLYAAAYSGLLLLLAGSVFARKELR
jgi:ABC-type transport system involved in multi-copper enzyme maturation permease subunit